MGIDDLPLAAASVNQTSKICVPSIFAFLFVHARGAAVKNQAFGDRNVY